MDGDIKFIGITGGSGSGKTTFLRELRRKFKPEQVCIVSQDDYYRARNEQITDDQGFKNFDIPYSIDHEAFYNDLIRLRNGETITRMEYTFNNPNVQPKEITLQPAPFIIVEGIFIFHFEEIRNLLDIKIFLHAKDNLKIIRRIKRDQIERNYPLDDVLYRYQHHVLPTYEKYIYPYMDDCDIVLNNNTNFDKSLSIIEGFLAYNIK
ncbi:MAG TPA: uridine kinase [Saprospiraceae bacterium]|jgi:uridine kinase|nr:uridine kinase [Saprospiraceae bacterium]HMZ73491.1 uridine kinase [Saprospiraceae bacterium]HNA95325.1 uridine kinase [Saprospiraceae bacterium]HNE66450.1 uridine kinase [Saprospiraceae bacterium]HNJ17380.1 uridine kinase [Saprospiraceae bacterium]